MNKIYFVRWICKFLPPILSQWVREKLISIKEGENNAINFKRKSFTGGYFSGNTRDFHSFRFFIHGYYDWRNVVVAKKLCKLHKGDVIEVGANIGTETISYVNNNPGYGIHAFEPVLVNFQSLVKLKNENNFHNLFLYNVLVGEKEGTAGFKIPNSNNSGSGYITTEIGKDIKKFEMVTLDKKLENLTSCSVIIMDVEGFETNVLKGSQKIITRWKPFLIMEVNPWFLNKRAKLDVSSFLNQIENLGYKAFYIERFGLKIVTSKNLTSKTNKNWVCIPNEKIGLKRYLSESIFWNALNPFISFRIL